MNNLSYTISHLFVLLNLSIAGLVSMPSKTQTNDYSAMVTNLYKLEGIPSASGIGMLNNLIYIAGDDSPFLFELDNNAQLLRKIILFDKKEFSGNRIPKKQKPDFESVVVVPWGADNDILVFGSGSGSGSREIMIRIDFDSTKAKVKQYQLKEFYKFLKKEAGIEKENLNIEGTAFWKNQLILLNRADDKLLLVDYKDFVDYVKDNDKKEPDLKITSYQLPVIHGVTARFSGACLLPEEDILLFSASVENDPNWVNEDEILGSFIGVIDLNQPQNTVPICTQIMYNDKPFEGKVESLVATKKFENKAEMIGVTDNDDGTSTMVQLVFKMVK